MFGHFDLDSTETDLGSGLDETIVRFREATQSPVAHHVHAHSDGEAVAADPVHCDFMFGVYPGPPTAAVPANPAFFFWAV